MMALGTVAFGVMARGVLRRDATGMDREWDAEED